VGFFPNFAMDKIATTQIPLTAPPPDDKAATEPPRDSWRSEELLGNRSEVQIVHNNEIYRLRRTRHGKLILYK
jgi:hemin uptake protein HemP